MPAYPQFIMFDGIDGSGKTTLVKFFCETIAKEKNLKVFNLPETCKSTGELPLPWTPIKEVIFSAEPTQVWVGAVIRKELISNDANYDRRTVAAAYAMDRLILYRRFLIPMLERNAIIIQDRGLSTSMVYQPIMKDGVRLEEIISYGGNNLAFDHTPGHLVIVKCSAKIGMSRIGGRSNKADNAIFEKEEFLTKAAERFESAWFRQIWEEHGTKVHYLNAEQPLEAVKADTAALARDIFQ